EAVLTRIADEPVPRPRWWRRHWRAMLGGLVALLAVALLAPPVRATVAEWFAFAGVVVRPDTGSAPSGAPPPPAVTGDLTMERARRLVDFTPLVPAALGTPGAVQVSADRRVLSMTWGRGDQTIRLDQFDGQLAPTFAKSAHGEVEFVPLRDGEAMWFPGPHHVVVLEPDGRERRTEARLAGRTLIWQVGAVTLRLEGDLTRDRAVEIAGSATG
ncbi:MAG: hypothetical protein ACRDT6_24565, partial [Micromonosporaceae bacterium]